MTTAEEWVKQLNSDNRVPPEVIEEASHNNVSIEQVKQIQLDAYKAGMTEAAEVYTVEMRKHTPRHISGMELEITQAILTARDNKTSL